MSACTARRPVVFQAPAAGLPVPRPTVFDRATPRRDCCVLQRHAAAALSFDVTPGARLYLAARALHLGSSTVSRRLDHFSEAHGSGAPLRSSGPPQSLRPARQSPADRAFAALTPRRRLPVRSNACISRRYGRGTDRCELVACALSASRYCSSASPRAFFSGSSQGPKFLH